jgi:hypothetical protein
MSKQQAPPSAANPPPLEDARTKLATAQYTMFQASADKVRERADRTAKGVAGIGTTVLTAIGIASVADVFPAPHNPRCSWWSALAIMVGAFLALAGGIAFFTNRLWKLNQPITITPDPERMKQTKAIEGSEYDEVKELFDRQARSLGAETLAMYDARAQRYGRIAEWAAPEDEKRFSAKACAMIAEVQAVEARARSMLVRKRAKGAISDKKAFFAYFGFVVAIVAYGMSADYLKAVRGDDVTTAKSCADAQEAGVQHLPTICNNWKISAKKPPTPAEAVAAAVSSLGTALAECEANVRRHKAKPPTCKPLRAAFSAAVSAPG